MPRRTVRRVILLLAMTLPSDLVDGFRGVLEAGAVHDRFEDRAEMKTRILEFLHDVADDAALAVVVDVSDGVAVHVARDAGDGVGVIANGGHELARSAELHAVEFAARVDGFSELGGALGADAIEILEAEPDGIH